MKFVFSAIIAFALLFLTSVQDINVNSAEANSAPQIVLKNDKNSISLENLNGHYVLVNFWSSSDAQSRINNSIFDKAIAGGKSSIEYIAINTDSDATLYNQILMNDGLDAKRQFRLADSKSGNLYKQYSLATGNHTFLIGPSGKIEKINPSNKELEKYL